MSAVLEQQVAIVTGSSRGIGKAICVELARQGATVLATARKPEAVAAWAGELDGLPGSIEPVALDVTDAAAGRA